MLEVIKKPDNILAYMLQPHFDLININAPKSEEQLPNLGSGIIRGARECSMMSLTNTNIPVTISE